MYTVSSVLHIATWKAKRSRYFFLQVLKCVLQRQYNGMIPLNKKKGKRRKSLIVFMCHLAKIVSYNCKHLSSPLS